MGSAAKIKLPSLDDVKQEYARRHLIDFADYAMWDDTVGRSRFVRGRHLEVIGNALERVYRRELLRLMIFAPPRHTKSLLSSQLFPAWCMGKDPRIKFVQTGYGDPIAVEHSRHAREFFTSHRYRSVFPGVRYQAAREAQLWLPPPKQSAHEWGTTEGGRYYAVGIGGALTGKGADILSIDDPVKNRRDADSPTYQKATIDWYRSVARTRLTPNGAIVITMTRWSPNDLAGFLLREMREGGEQWEVLEFKALDKEGNALWPEMWPVEKLRALERSLGPREWDALYQQNPSDAGGTIMKRDWWTGQNRYQQPAFTNACVARILSWDTAEKIGEDNAYSACGTYEMPPAYKMGVTGLWHDRVEFTDLVAAAIRLAEQNNRDGKLRAIVIEDKSSGTALIQTLRKQAPQWIRDMVVAASKHESKELRAHTASVYCKEGAVLLPEPGPSTPWLMPFEDDLYAFPGCVYKDRIDQFTQAVWYWENYLASGLGIQVVH